MKKSKGVKESDADLISYLPDPIIHSILSRLQGTEEVVCTSILSKRWKYLWTSVPSIDLDCTRVLKPRKPLNEINKRKFKEFVYWVLEISSLDLDSFRLHCGYYYDMSTVGRWIDAAVRRNVKQLDLNFCVEDMDDAIELPRCLVTCKSLEVLKLSLYEHCLSLPKFTGFPSLRVLKLDNCKLVNYDLVNNFLKSLTLLEGLSLIDCETYDLDFVSISCPKLQNLKIDNRNTHMEYGIEGICSKLQICCPKLLFLDFNEFMAKEITFESLDSLEKAVIHPEDTFEWSGKGLCDVFAGISHVESLALCICLIEEDMNLENFPKSLPNLKTLEVTTTIHINSMDLLTQILACSPNLESLHVIIEEDSLYSFDHDEDSDFDFDLFEDIECTFEQLKMVRVTGASAFKDDTGFIKFLLGSTPFLETMRITPCVKVTDENLRFLTCVYTFQRASPEAEIILVQDQV